MKQLGRFYQFIFQKPALFIAHVSLLIVATILSNLTPFFIAWLTDLVTTQNWERMLWVILGLGGVMVLANLFLNLTYYIQNINVAHLSSRILQNIMAKVHQLDFAFHANKSSGKLLSIMNRGDDAVFVFYASLNDEILIVVIGFLMMSVSFAALSWKYLGLTIIFLVVAAVSGYLILKDNLKRRKAFNREDDRLSASKVDNLINFDTVKYFAKEKFEQKRLRGVLNEWVRTLLHYFVSFRFFDLVIINSANIFTVLMALVAWHDLRAGYLSGPEFIFILTFAMTVLPQMARLMNIVRQMARKSDDLERYLGILDEEISVPDPTEPKQIVNKPGVVEFRDVDFGYNPDKKMVIQDFSLRIEPGEAVALVGFSGAGKTTIIKLLMRMYDVTQGSITIDGVDVREMNKDYLRSLVSIVPQEPLLFNNKVSYNIKYSKPDASDEEMFAAAKAAQADGFIKGLLDGYKTKVGERGIKLSGGQRQRLAIARVLLQGAQIVIFDEATSSLDSASEQAVQDAFWQMAKNAKRPVSSIIIAHRLSTIMRADRIIVMDEGRIAEIGSHKKLLAQRDSIYKKLWDLQQDGFIGDGECGNESGLN